MTRILYTLLLCSITLACGGADSTLQSPHNGPGTPHETTPPTIRWAQPEYSSTFDLTGNTNVSVLANIVNGTDPLPAGINVRVHPLTREPFCKGITGGGCPLGGGGSILAWLWPKVGTPWHPYTGGLQCPSDWMCGELACTPDGCSIGLQLSCVPAVNAPSIGDYNFKVQIDYVDVNAIAIASDIATVHCTW